MKKHKARAELTIRRAKREHRLLSTLISLAEMKPNKILASAQRKLSILSKETSLASHQTGQKRQTPNFKLEKFDEGSEIIIINTPVDKRTVVVVVVIESFSTSLLLDCTSRHRGDGISPEIATVSENVVMTSAVSSSLISSLNSPCKQDQQLRGCDVEF